MKSWSIIIIGSFFAIMLVFGLSLAAQPSFADDDHHEYRMGEHYGEHEEGGERNEAFEEGGELLGWGSVIAIGGAAVIMPLRRNSSKLIKTFPNAKASIVSGLKLFSKSHIWIGALAVTLSAIHGVLMYLNEGEFGFREFAGTLSVGFMAIAAIFGVMLAKNKGKKQIRSIHFGLLTVAVIIAAVHIATS